MEINGSAGWSSISTRAETTEVLDAPAGSLNYSIPFARIASIVPADPESDEPVAAVFLRDGETLLLEAAGDLGSNNAGILLFEDGIEEEMPQYLPWAEVEQIDFDR